MNEATKKKVSIGLAVYNEEKYIEQVLESLLEQSYSNIEIHISDNASEDKTCSIIETNYKEHDNIFLNKTKENIS